MCDAILRERPHPEMGFRSCLGILRLAKQYDDQRLERACSRAVVSPAPQAKTNLSASQALQIACNAAANDSMSDQLSITLLKERDGKPAWLVASATIGASLEVWIDDETGRVLELKHVGLC